MVCAAQTTSRSSPTVTEFCPVPSIPTSFRTRNTSTVPSAIPIRKFDNGHCSTPKTALRLPVACTAEMSLCVRRWFKLSGHGDIRQRKQWFAEVQRHRTMRCFLGQRLLVEYKPFEPAFYHTDIADWGILCSSLVPPVLRPRFWLIPDSLRGAEHRANRRMASVGRYAWRFSLQRSPLRR